MYACEEDLELGLRFYDAVDRALATLVEQPYLGSVQEWLAGRLLACRRWPVSKPFDVHQVFYLASDAGIGVLRAPRGTRDLPRLLG